jgi:hypothetical protein
MTPAGVQAAARVIESGAFALVCAVLALCASAALVQAAVDRFDEWRARRQYRRIVAESIVDAGATQPPPNAPFPPARDFPREVTRRRPLDS